MNRPLPLSFASAALLALSACASTAPDVQSNEAELSARDTPACTEPPIRDCGFYAACLEREQPCGADGYALGYGDRYCRRFLASPHFSERGVVWRDETMLCLQKRLGRFLGDTSATCEQIKDGAFDDHPACYTQPHASICDLPWSDWLEVVATIDLGDLLSGRGRKQIAATAHTCITGWFTPPWLRSPGGGDEASLETDVLAHDADAAAKRAIAQALERDPNVELESLRVIAEAAHEAAPSRE